VTLLSRQLPGALRLDDLSIRPGAMRREAASPGSAGYFDGGAAGAAAAGLLVELRGNAATSDDVAALLRALAECGRFRTVRLTRVDRGEAEASGLRFEMVCEL
jgi:hypothetical protein